VASGSIDKTVRVWDIQTGECQYTLEGHSGSVKSVVFSPDGLRVASGSNNMTVRVWDITSATELLCHNPYTEIHSIEFSDDSTKILINGKMVSIPSRIPLSTTAVELSKPSLNAHGRLGVTNGEWLTWSSEKILWLPPEYRPGSWASHDDIAVIGSRTGRVIFVRRVVESSVR
jgi:WD40 repeat protein